MKLRVLNFCPYSSSIGGGIKMNAGCYGNEFKDIIVSVQAIDLNGLVSTIYSSEIVLSTDHLVYPKI